MQISTSITKTINTASLQRKMAFCLKHWKIEIDTNDTGVVLNAIDRNGPANGTFTGNSLDSVINWLVKDTAKMKGIIEQDLRIELTKTHKHCHLELSEGGVPFPVFYCKKCMKFAGEVYPGFWANWWFFYRDMLNPGATDYPKPKDFAPYIDHLLQMGLVVFQYEYAKGPYRQKVYEVRLPETRIASETSDVTAFRIKQRLLSKTILTTILSQTQQ